MLKINKQTITLTKGDDASLRLVPRYKDRTEYVLTEGDSAVFRIKFGHTLVELECTLNLETNKIVANITPNDTKDYNPGIYRYEAELITSYGFHYTFIADQTFILGQEYEQRITSTSNGNSSAVGGNLPEIDGIVDGEPVVYGDIQPTNPMMDYDELNHLPKLNNKTIKGDHDSEYYGIATKTSELENDSDFVSDDDYVHTDNNYDDTAKDKVDALGTASTYDVPESGNAGTSQVVKGDDSRLTDARTPLSHTHSKADITDFPTNVSAFNNDSGFITNTVNNLANYYLKTQTYTQTEVDNLISAAVSGRFQKVNSLPASGQPNVIYLVPKADPETSNTCDEYIWQDNVWELIGSTDVDLSDYVTDDELTTALQSYLTTSAFNTAIANYYTKTETDNLLGNKVDKVAGKGLSTNDYDNTAKGIVDGVTSALNDKVDKVQGKGLSTNDYDNTAKGIVDGVTSALAGKVDKENGKGLSTEDYTTADKTKLSGISDNATKTASSTTNGHIEIDDVDTTVYDDTAVTTAIENIEDELSTDSATVEGNPINFSTLSAQNAESTIIDLEPIQDLHGYDKPWVGGAGKNKLPLDVATIKSLNISGTWNGNVYTIGTRTFTILFDSDNNIIGIKVNGSDTSISTFDIIADNNLNINCILNGCPTGGSEDTFELIAFGGSTSYRDRGSSTDFNWNTNLTLRIIIRNNYSANNLIFKPMVRLSTETDATFAPYTNECSISGRSEILGCGKNLWSDGDESFTLNKTIQLDKPLEVGKYTFSALVTSSDTNQSTCRVNFMDVDNTEIVATYIDRNTRANVTANLVRECTSIVLYASTQYSYSVGDTALFKDIQLEQGEQPSDFEPYTLSNDLTISFGQTVYGGQVDVEKGLLVVDKGYADLSTLSWTWQSSWEGWYTNITGIQRVGEGIPDLVSEKYEPLKFLDISQNHKIGIAVSGASDLVLVNDNSTTDAPTGAIAYKLATPITINLTPNTINLLKGVNNISTTANGIKLTYRNGSVATLEDVKLASEDLEQQIADAQILTDTATGDKYILVVTNGVLSVEQVSN